MVTGTEEDTNWQRKWGKRWHESQPWYWPIEFENVNYQWKMEMQGKKWNLQSFLQLSSGVTQSSCISAYPKPNICSSEMRTTKRWNTNSGRKKVSTSNNNNDNNNNVEAQWSKKKEFDRRIVNKSDWLFYSLILLTIILNNILNGIYQQHAFFFHFDFLSLIYHKCSSSHARNSCKVLMMVKAAKPGRV